MAGNTLSLLPHITVKMTDKTLLGNTTGIKTAILESKMVEEDDNEAIPKRLLLISHLFNRNCFYYIVVVVVLSFLLYIII
mmetsp:Transcript_1696/g.2725  ORF Transcript_1696/g.2725 Transcript_1696/m.2725 type:complete len:80 (+) Transcript_1696:905-1144(+)